MKKFLKLILLSLGLFCVGFIVYFIYMVKQLPPIMEGVYPPGDHCVYSEFFEERDGLEYEKGSDTPFTGVYTCVTPLENFSYVYESTYKDGKRNGPTVSTITPEGDVFYKGHYKNGEPDGLWEWFHNSKFSNVSSTENGQLSIRENYKDGELNGLKEEFHPNGQLWIRGNYKNGKEVGLFERFHENGQLGDRGNYKDGKEEGLWEDYYSNGQIFMIWNFKDGKEDGPYEMYHENGQLEERGNYKKEKKDGLFEWFDEESNLTKTEVYKDGELIE